MEHIILNFCSFLTHSVKHSTYVHICKRWHALRVFRKMIKNCLKNIVQSGQKKIVLRPVEITIKFLYEFRSRLTKIKVFKTFPSLLCGIRTLRFKNIDFSLWDKQCDFPKLHFFQILACPREFFFWSGSNIWVKWLVNEISGSFERIILPVPEHLFLKSMTPILLIGM